VILSCLAKDPAARPQTARDLSSELQRCRDAQGWNPADAEKWWTELESSPAAAAKPTPAESSEPVRRTICCADLDKRCARRDDDAPGLGLRPL
jgi:hypothetical protein